MMVVMLDPAALGGLAGLIALAGWSIGRVQGRWLAEPAPDAATGCAIPAEPQPGLPAWAEMPLPAATAAAPAPCQHPAREERPAQLARVVSLTDLHDEVRAIRKDACILRDIAPGEAPDLPWQGRGADPLPLSRW